MPTTAAFVHTPYYVLMEGKRRLGPKVEPLPSGAECLAVYGFSDKACFDKFCANSQLALVPYPLTKFYLQDQTNFPGNNLNLVVVDAAGPHDPCIRAGTMEAVLRSQEDQTLHVTAACSLTFDPEATAYRVTVKKNLKKGARR